MSRPAGFPWDDYTPFGYLNTPNHTRSRPLGVIRATPGPGFSWRYPAYAGGYGGRHEVYQAGLALDLPGAAFTCPYHSSGLVRYELALNGGTLQVSFHAFGDAVLRLHARFSAPAKAAPATVTVRAAYARRLAAGGQWGESGLVGRPEPGGLSFQTFEDGPAFTFTCDRPTTGGLGSAPPAPGEWPAAGFVCALATHGEQASLHGALAATLAPGEEATFLLARGPALPGARRARGAAMREGRAWEQTTEAADARFWAAAPVLSGAWPAHWRRGLVYDLETLRMMLRPPSGSYAHPWDAMQVQAPRVVLAETAMDALALSLADPEIAQRLLLGAFLDASGPNVPCSREDGGHNMIAADGEACGTGPQWGFPFLVARELHRARPDGAWLRAITGKLDEHLEWWLEQRAAAAGDQPWLGFACSWESGQDDSPRFLEQPLGGGHPVRRIRPVDLHAAVAHAAQVLEGFWRELGDPGRVARWTAVAATYAALTERLWNGERYTDLDGRDASESPDGRPTGVDDIMLLTPWALGVASPAHAAAGRVLAARLDERGEAWPMFGWVATEAALKLGRSDQAASLVAAMLERAYTRWDERHPAPGAPMPGLASEYWPHAAPGGGEGYGWGAFGVYLLVATLVGYRPLERALTLRPNLPPDWRVAGREYTLRLTHHGAPLTISLTPTEAGGCRLSVNGARRDAAWGEIVDLTDDEVMA